MIKILCLTGTLTASTQIRILGPLNLLEKNDMIRQRVVFVSRKTNPDLKHIQWADIIVFQRQRSKKWLKLLKHAQKNRRMTVFEIDDNMFEIPKGHPEYGLLNRIKNKKYMRFIKRVDCVTVSTEELCNYLSKYTKRICVLPNYIDKEICNFDFSKREKKKYITIGYSGGKTHKPDLEIVIPAIKKILDEFPNKVQFKFLGYIPSELIEYSQIEYIGLISDYRTYLYSLKTSGIDFAIAPLKDNLFNRCKSNIKFLEYSICGIPGIYSNVKPYTDIVKDRKTGIIVNPNSSDNWHEAMKLIILDKNLRENIARNCYEYVNKHWLLQDNFTKWFEVYSSLMKNKK